MTTSRPERDVVGLLLAAGTGRRLGRPKALVSDAEGCTWLERAAAALQAGGVDLVYVVVGAEQAAVEAAIPLGCVAVHCLDWQEGMGASLRAGLTAVQLNSLDADAVVVMLVDTPGVKSDVVRRLIEQARANPEVTQAVVRAAYDGAPGHPVLIGRAHWTGVLDSAAGDRGARDYLVTVPVELIECGDVGTGEDIDTPEALAAWSQQARPPD